MTDFSYTSNCELRDIAERIRTAETIALVTHEKVDGDAIGSLLAISRALTNASRRGHILLSGPVQSGLQELAGSTPVTLLEADMPDIEPDLIILCDTGARRQLGVLEGWISERGKKVIVIDHHMNGDDIGAMRYIRSDRCATTHIVCDLLDELDWEIAGGPESVAEALFLGLATDTGWFRFRNADAACFALASRLIDSGVDTSRIYRFVEESHRPERMAILARLLHSLQWHADGRVAVMMIGPVDFTEAKASPEDLTGLVNVPMEVTGVDMSVLLASVDDGQTKISFRSKPSATQPGAITVDVNQIARQFGGGGHAMAAGARMDADLAQAHDAVVEAISRIDWK